MRKLVFVAAVMAVSVISGCATIDGVGRDISGGANRVNGWLN